MLRVYFAEIVARHFARPATEAEIGAAMAGDPGDDLMPPGGLFMLAWRGEEPVGCVGVRLLSAEIAELKRMFVTPAVRRLGYGSELIAAAERAALGLGASVMRLDTRHDLVEARALYAKHSYREIASYSAAPYAEHWFEKLLAVRQANKAGVPGDTASATADR